MQDINLEDRTYVLNPFIQYPDDSLLHSISDFGMLHPPLLLEKQDRSLIVLSGRRRIEAYLQISRAQKSLPALIISSDEDNPNPANSPYLFTLLLQHQLLGGSLSIIEQAVFFRKASLTLKEEDVLNLLPVLGMKAKPHIPGELIALLDLEPAVQIGLHRGIITQRSGKTLSRFSQADQKQLAELIEQFQFGGSKQQKMIDRFFQLSKREQISVEILLSQWREKEKDKQLNGPQRASSLLRWLDRQCQPSLTQAEEEFRKFCSRLQLPVGVQIDHTLSFEDEQVTLRMNFGSKEELALIWPRMKKLLNSR